MHGHRVVEYVCVFESEPNAKVQRRYHKFSRQRVQRLFRWQTESLPMCVVTTTSPLSRRPSPDKSRFRNVWSAAELQAENEDDSWSALMYSAFGGVKDSGP